MTRMKNKVHGIAHAYGSDQEAEMRKNGWIGYDEEFDDPVDDALNGHPIEPSSETPAPAAKPRKPRAKKE